MKIVSDVLLLSYFYKFGLSVTVEAGQSLAVLYSEARLYKGPRLAGLSQSATVIWGKTGRVKNFKVILKIFRKCFLGFFFS